MNYTVSVSGLLLLALATAGAQVASHTPTVFKPAPTTAAASVPQVPSAKPVVRVNGSVLTDADLIREEYAIFPYARQHNGLPPDLAPQIRDGAMKMIIFEELVYQEALRRKMTIPSAKMQKAESDFHKQFSNPEEFNALLQSEFHGSEKQFQEKIRRSLLIEALLKIEIDNKSIVTAADVRAYYDQTPARFKRSESYTFQAISVLPPAKATAEQLNEGRARADRAWRQAKATKTPEEFGLLAEKISDDDYRVMMGQHKPVSVDQLAPQVVKALHSMKPGDVSDVIQIEQAYTIVRLQQHDPAGEEKFEEVKDLIQEELQQKKSNQLRAALDQKLHQNAKVEEL